MIALCWMLYLAVDLNVRPAHYERNIKLLILIGITTVFGMVTSFAVPLLNRIRPIKYDLYVYRIDGVFGFEPSFVLARAVRKSPFVAAFIVLCYRGLISAITAALAFHSISGSRREFRAAVRAFVLVIYVGAIFYVAIPVAGPRYVFKTFPMDAAAVSVSPVLVHAAPNGMPSVHMSCALLILFFCWKDRVARRLAAIFAGLTAIAALATGEHYLVDLVAALPYTVLILWLSGAFSRELNCSSVLTVNVNEESPVGNPSDV
jgi:hypothetical protein